MFTYRPEQLAQYVQNNYEYNQACLAMVESLRTIVANGGGSLSRDHQRCLQTLTIGVSNWGMRTSTMSAQEFNYYGSGQTGIQIARDMVDDPRVFNEFMMRLQAASVAMYLYNNNQDLYNEFRGFSVYNDALVEQFIADNGIPVDIHIYANYDEVVTRSLSADFAFADGVSSVDGENEAETEDNEVRQESERKKNPASVVEAVKRENNDEKMADLALIKGGQAAAEESIAGIMDSDTPEWMSGTGADLAITTLEEEESAALELAQAAPGREAVTDDAVVADAQMDQLIQAVASFDPNAGMEANLSGDEQKDGITVALAGYVRPTES